MSCGNTFVSRFSRLSFGPHPFWYADQNLAVIRHLAPNLLKQERSAKVGIKAKRKKAGWDFDYLIKVPSQ